jgi:hypothetical protein
MWIFLGIYWKSFLFQMLYSTDEYISSKNLNVLLFVIVDDVPKLCLIISPTLFGSFNGVQVSFVILSLFVIVVDSILSLQSSLFSWRVLYPVQIGQSDQWNYGLCMYVCMYVCFRRNVVTKPLLRNGCRIFAYCIATTVYATMFTSFYYCLNV